MNNLIYGIQESPKTLKEFLLYGAQQCISVLTASILISTICGTDVAAGLVGAGVATIVFLVLTGFKAPLFFSNSGATAGAVIAALALGHDYTAVILGGVVICIMNSLAALATLKLGSAWVQRLLPPIVSGTIVLIIGLNLSAFCPTYALVNGEYSVVGIAVALATMLITVITMYYAKGMLSTLPFLIGVLGGYIISIVVTLLGIAPLVDFSVFTNMSLFIKPRFAFLNCDFAAFDWSLLPTIILIFGAVNLANIGEHISDVVAVSTVVQEDLTKTVGLHKTFFGDGIADLVGTIIGGQPTTTYSESLSTIAVSRVASTRVIGVAALMTILLGFFGPFNALIVSMPNCIFCGVSIVAYGCIAYAGIRTLHNVELTPKNMIIFACMGSIGIGGLAINIGKFTLQTVAFSMIVGLILNLILKEN